MNHEIRLVALLLGAIAGTHFAGAQTAIPPSLAMPAGSVDTATPGFRVRPYQTAETQPRVRTRWGWRATTASASPWLP